ncbi:HugZ family pyridoxamine 5'-phosphate oxidase [Indioceanicola profundi]|uniref:HugZ family pyridoxamine 5'-phosphate oxidase n=1 Tax=Indioceanicola profundi TaxID=2220096 RepID=UPI000E6ABDE6|nr:DUF2470 domain-containing protein [Indioceanicola profundi]
MTDQQQPEMPAWTGEYPTSARAVMRAQGQAAMATAQRDADGWPYPSLVLTAFDLDGSPLLLISGLADHTRNLAADSRAGLLFDGTAGLEEPLTGPRVSLLGRLEPTEEPRHRARYLARHPSAELYAGFGDFRLWRMRVERAHLVAGFGKIRWIGAEELLPPPAAWEALTAREQDVVGHMNADHADAVRLYATVLLGRPDGEWRMTGIDPDGCDLRCATRTARLEFGTSVDSAEAARVELVRLVRKARAGG